MKTTSQRLCLRIVIPGALVIVAVLVIQLIFINKIVRSIQTDYSRLQIVSAGSEVAKILSTAVSELTSSRLIDNPVVVESKQRSVIESIILYWSRSGYEGIVITAEGKPLINTVRGHDADKIIAARVEDFFVVSNASGRYICSSHYLPLWGWHVITVGHDHHLFSRGKVALLIPLVLAGCLLMMAGIYVVIRKNLQQPLKMIINDMNSGSSIRSTGITELDAMACTVNSAVATLKENAAVLQAELTERLHAEEALLARDSHIKNLLDFMEEGMYGVDLEGFCTFSNASCLSMLGYDNEADLQGCHIHSKIHHTHTDGSRYLEGECKAYEPYRTMEKVHIQGEVFWRADGSSFPVDYWSHPVFIEGVMVGAVVTFRNITEELLLQQQILQQQKLESIGLLAGGIAHDFNNMLTPIFGYAEMIRSNHAPGEKDHLRASGILAASGKARDLVAQLLSFSKKQTLTTALYDLNEIITTFSVVFQRAIRENISFTLRLSGTPCTIKASRPQIEQIILNLAVNAQDAIREAGEIALETGHMVFDDEYCRIHPGTKPGTYIMLAFSDTGCGMEDETLKHIFDPFFSTKAVGHGTGLGLSTLFGIVKQHEGFIDVQSHLNVGTTFRIFLPEMKQAADKGNALDLHKPDSSPMGVKTILLVEDNQMVMDLVFELLTNAGHTVLSSLDPEVALGIAATHSGTIDLLVSDVIMPKMNGPELYERLKDLYPELPVLFMSGYLGNTTIHNGQLEEDVNCISKPFTNEQFLEKLNEVVIMSMSAAINGVVK